MCKGIGSESNMGMLACGKEDGVSAAGSKGNVTQSHCCKDTWTQRKANRVPMVYEDKPTEGNTARECLIDVR